MNGKILCEPLSQKYSVEAQKIPYIFYLDFVESHYMPKELKTLTQEKWKTEDNTEVIASHPPVETIIIGHKKARITTSPFKIPEQNNNY